MFDDWSMHNRDGNLSNSNPRSFANTLEDAFCELPFKELRNVCELPVQQYNDAIGGAPLSYTIVMGALGTSYFFFLASHDTSKSSLVKH